MTGAPGAPSGASGGPREAMPGIRTFAGLPHRLVVEGFDVAVVGVPWDGGASARPGARFGPEAIRRASRGLERYHPTHHIDVFARRRAVDRGDVELVPGDELRAFDEVEGELTVILGAGATPVVIGGDHTVLEGELSALASVVGPCGLVMLDAHTDTLEEPDEDRGSRGGALRRAVLEGVVRPDRSLLAGLRGPLTGPAELSWPEAVGFELISCSELAAQEPDEFGARVRARVGDAPVLLSVDLDVVDPAFAPAVGTPEVGGLTSGQLIDRLRALAGLPFRAYSVCELTPPYDTVGHATALLAANVVFEFLGLAATAA